MDNFYFTFGDNHKDKFGNPLGHAYCIVQGEDRWEAREKFMAVRGKAWAFEYSESEFEGQIERFGLHEVSIEEL